MFSVSPAWAAGSADSRSRDVTDVVHRAFGERVRALNSNNTKALEGFYVQGSDAIAHEASRQMAWRAVEKKLGGPITAFTLDRLDMMDPTLDGNNAMLKAYEVIMFSWKDAAGGDNLSGLGVWHDITLAYANANWRIVSDAYDEGPLVWGQPCSNPNIATPTVRLASAPDAVVNPKVIYVPYNRSNAASYADSWVIHNSTIGYNVRDASYYNPAYKNYNPPDYGGDCANFVSQALFAGGWQYDSSWWYNNNGTGGTQTSDDTASTTWTYAPTHFSYWAGARGVQVGSPSQLDTGDPVYYDWAYVSPDGPDKIQHVAIVVGRTTDGVPLVDAHNWDYYHVPYSGIVVQGDKIYLVHVNNYIPWN
jgi:hypothetical protein